MSARIASTIDLRAHPPFAARADVLRPVGWPKTRRNQLLLLMRILRAGLRRRPLALYSSWGPLKPDLLALALFGLLPRRRRPATVLVGEMWQPTPGRARLERLVVRLADRAVGQYLVYSGAEAEILPSTWPVAAGRVTVRPFYFAPTEHGLAPGDRGTRGDYVFAGGDSFRDFAPLLEAARRLPDVRFRLVTRSLSAQGLPDNVEVQPAVYRDYVALMRSAAAVVVPIRTDLRRSAGILTFIMAMWLEKPTIVPAALAVDEYLEDGRTGLLVDGSAEGYERALRHLLDPARRDEVAEMGAAARRVVEERFTFGHYADGVLAALDEVTRRDGHGR